MKLTDHLNKWVLIAVLILVVLISFGRSLQNGYALDDNLVTYPNPKVQKGIFGIGEILTTKMANYNGDGYEYRPIATISYAIEYQFFGFDPHISHAINLLIYTLICILLFHFLMLLFGEHKKLVIFLSILIFAIHPIHSEVVLSLKNRDEMLALLFGIGAMIASLRYVVTRKNYMLVVVSILFLLATFSKVSASPLAVVIPFLLYYFQKIGVKEAILLFCFLFTLGCVRFLWMNIIFPEGFSREFLFFENPLYYSQTFADRIPMFFYTFFFYVKSCFWPYPLVSYYGYNAIPIADWSVLEVYFGILMILLIALSIFWFWFKNKLIVSGLFIWLAAIVPYCNLLIPAPGIVAERFAFISVLGFGFIVSGFISLIQKSSIIKVVYVILLLSTFLALGLNWKRSAEWKDYITLFRADVKKLPESAKLHAMVGSTLLNSFQSKIGQEVELSEVEEAIYHFKESIRIDSSLASSYNSLGLIYFSGYKDNEASIRLYKKAVELSPENAIYHYNLGKALVAIRSFDEALLHMDSACKLEKSNEYFCAELSNLKMKMEE